MSKSHWKDLKSNFLTLPTKDLGLGTRVSVSPPDFYQVADENQMVQRNNYFIPVPAPTQTKFLLKWVCYTEWKLPRQYVCLEHGWEAFQ